MARSNKFSGRNKAALGGALMATALLAGCASTPGAGASAQWLKLEQVEKRFAIFTNAPVAPAEGGIATFRLLYVYMPETVKFEEKYVGWQEYPAMTVNCEADTVRVGPRTRYAPDGTAMMSDDNQAFVPIMGPSIQKVKAIACDGAPLAVPVLIKDGASWIDAARKHIAATDPS
jgi:hypothetical protein